MASKAEELAQIERKLAPLEKRYQKEAHRWTGDAIDRSTADWERRTLQLTRDRDAAKAANDKAMVKELNRQISEHAKNRRRIISEHGKFLKDVVEPRAALLSRKRRLAAS